MLAISVVPMETFTFSFKFKEVECMTTVVGGGGGGVGYDEFDFRNVSRISHVGASVGGAIWRQPDFEQHGRVQQHYDYY